LFLTALHGYSDYDSCSSKDISIAEYKAIYKKGNDMKDVKKKLTTRNGAAVVDNQNAMTAGPRSPVLSQDVWYLDKPAYVDGEVIPERRMHAKGSGAYGTFTVR
jgi:catalase